MYRTYPLEEILKNTAVYSNPKSNTDINLLECKTFFSNPNKDLLVKILIDKKIKKEIKQGILIALNTSLNFTSLKPFLNNKNYVEYLVSNIPMNLMYNFEQTKSIVEYILNKSQNTNVYSKMQIQDIKSSLADKEVTYNLSENGFTDIEWSTNSAGADGIINYNNEQIILYARYGTGTGGSQNDRYRNMFDTSIKNPNRKFIFVVDGPECVLEYNLCIKSFEDNPKEYKNAIWCTSSILKDLDFETFKLKKLDII